MRSTKLAALGLAALLTLPALAACSSQPADPGPADPGEGKVSSGTAAELTDLYKAAKDSGQTEVVAYGPPGALNAAVAEDFAKAFPGMSVKYEYIFGAELQSRVAAEYSQGKPNVDVFISGAVDDDAFREAGYLEPYVPSTAKELDPKFQESHWASPIFVVMGPMYNTNQLKGGDVPAKWDDLVSSALKGGIGTSDPKVPATAAFMIGAALKEGVIDEKWLDDLAALDPKIFPSQTATVQAIASGQSKITLLVSYNNYLAAKKDGAPVGFSMLEEGLFAWPQAVALAKDASAPDAAKLFIAWLYSEEGQASVANTGIQGTMPDAPRVDGLEKAKLFTYPHKEVLSEYDSVHEIIAGAFGK